MSVKLLMHWDIKPGRDQDYFEFVIRDWLPGVNKIGVHPVWAWYTIYSRNDDTAQITAEVVADDLPTMRTALGTEDWAKLHERLLEYVQNYRHKVVRVTGDFQM
jgi:hypothetical protein